jgi:hypothetical protein
MLRSRLAVPLACAAAVAAVVVPAAGAGASPLASAAANCSIPHHGEHLGPTYLTALSVRATSCANGLKVVSGYHQCQVRSGGVKAICKGTVLGFRCTEKRGPTIPTEFYSTVSCTAGGGKVVDYKYAQFT